MRLGLATLPPSNDSEGIDMKRSNLLIGGITLAALIGLGCGSAVDSRSSQGRPPAPAAQGDSSASTSTNTKDTFGLAVGSSVIATDGEGSVQTTVTKATYRPKACQPNDYNRPANGGYLVIDVTVSVTKGKGSVNPLFFVLVDAAGAQIDEAVTAGCRTLAAGNEYPAGTTLTGQLAYDTAARAGTFMWSVGLGTQVGSWAIKA